MKGVVLAGGLGTRLSPLTKVTNKHLLPVWDQPMIYYPIQTLANAGITEICLVTGGNYAGEFLRLLRNGHEFGLKQIHYEYQEGEGGIADALRLARHFVGGEDVVVVLGDNIIEGNIRAAADAFRQQGGGARLLFCEVSTPERFGVPQFDGQQLVRIIEKPSDPPSRYAVIGIYMYDNQVFDIIETLEPSGRGELEITDVNNRYLDQGQLEYDVIDGWWTDAGTFESLYRASMLVRDGGANKMDLGESR